MVSFLEVNGHLLLAVFAVDLEIILGANDIAAAGGWSTQTHQPVFGGVIQTASRCH